MNRDSFQRQKDSQPLASRPEGTAPLQGDAFLRGSQPLELGAIGTAPPSAAGTSPLTARSRPLITPAALKALMDDTIAKATPLVESLEPRIELLIRACQAAELPIPGVAINEFKHPLSPNGQKIIVYLQRALKVREGLARQVQVAVFRYQEACESVEVARLSLELNEATSGILEDLKRRCFYLTNFHQEFRMDPILTQIFPPPKGGASTTGGLRRPGTGGLSQTELLQKKRARDQLVTQAEGLQSNLAPKMEVVKAALPLLTSSTGRQLMAFISGTDRHALALSRKLKGDKVATDQLKQALVLYQELGPQLEAVKAGGGIDHLSQILAHFSQFAATWQTHPFLKDFANRSAQELFSES